MNVLVRLLRETAAQRRIPPHVVDFAAQHLRQAGRRLRRLVQRARQAPEQAVVRRSAAAAGAPLVVHTDGTWQAAVDFRFSDVRRVTQDTLAAVCRLLEVADIAYFVRDATSAGVSVIGVHDRDRGLVWNALTAADYDSLLYARAVTGDRAVALWRGGHVFGELARSERVLVYRNHRVSDAHVVGASHGCVIEFWQRAGDNLRPPAGATPGRLVLSDLSSAEVVVGGRPYPTLLGLADHRSLLAPTMPIDAVYTWVDDTDPRWRRSLDRVLTSGRPPLHPEAVNPSRFRNRDELRYSLRSLSLYADFVRRVFIVTDGQVPTWLDTDRSDVTIIDHSELLDPAHLPTFNSHAIESRLHHIDGLSEHYLYLNDDFMFGRQVTAGTFFTANGLAKMFPDELAPIPSGPPTTDDRPVDSASKNVRDLMRRHLGMHVRCKMQHVPYPQRRSVLAEMERRFPEEFERTAASRFRQPTDVNIPSCFTHYYAFATGRSVPGDIEAEYINVGFRWSSLQMRRLLDQRDRDAFCLNETDLQPAQAASVDRAVQQFLSAYLPVRSRWERPSDQVSSRKYEAMSVNP